MQLMAALVLVLLLLALFPSTAFTTTDIYYVTADDAAAGHEPTCPPHQICHNLSYYISQPDHYFTSDTTIIFLEGQHSFDREDRINVSNVHNLTLKGQGLWPVPTHHGENVMQSGVIINCTRSRGRGGGFYFGTSHNITVTGLTVRHCGTRAVFNFYLVTNLLFYKNSIQYMTGYGLFANNSQNVTITNSSYFHSAKCRHCGGAVGIVYEGSTQYSNTSYTLKLSYSNMTKCVGYRAGGIFLSGFGSANLLFSHLVLLGNYGGGGGGGMTMKLTGGTSDSSSITIQNTDFVENKGRNVDEIQINCNSLAQHAASLYILNSTIQHERKHRLRSFRGVQISGSCSPVKLANTKMAFVNIYLHGFTLSCNVLSRCKLQMNNCQFEGSTNVPIVLSLLNTVQNVFTNCTFSNNTGGQSVISIYQSQLANSYNTFINCTISDNNMTGLTLFGTAVHFIGRNVIQNNRNTEGAGITIGLPSLVIVEGQLLLYNNTADKQGGAIIVKQLPVLSSRSYDINKQPCTLHCTKSTSLIFSGNRAGKGGSDMYGAILMGCAKISPNQLYLRFWPGAHHITHVGHPNETSWYFDTPFIKYFHFNNTDRLSSMSSDPIMICFCNTSNLPDCSDRTQHHIQTYPGLEISTSIATVGYYGGTSPGVVLVSAQHATLVRYYGQNETTNCFQLHILLQKTSSTTALVDIKVKDVVQGLNVSIAVAILECPIGFTLISGQCHCEQILAKSNVQCNLSATPYKFLSQSAGNSWFAYNNNTQCITGTTYCPFDYCNRSNISFDIMAPDRQCVANRVGILCGQCQSHLSIMLGSNRCGTCSNWYLYLLPVFALAGIVLVAVLMFLKLSVSVGTINGLLFYVNMVKLNSTFFFPNGSIPVVSQFISWLNLDLGIEVCLLDGLDSYWNTWLQFAFPVYLFLLMGGIIVGCRYSVWLCRLCGSHAVPALATLFLMSYTKILLTVTNALSMSRLPCNDSILTVWSVDGNIEYGSGKHLILVVISCGVLVVGLAYPVLVLCAPLLERYSHKCIPLHRWNPVAKFKPLLDAYGGPYKDKFRFWTGVTLMMRLIVTVTFSFTSGGLAVINAYIITTIVVGILTFWSFTKGVYKNIYLSALEAFHLLNLFLVSTVILATASLGSRSYQIATIISVCLSFAICLVTMAMHLWWNFDHKKIKRRLGFKDQPEYTEVPQVAEDERDEEDRPPPGSPPSIVYDSRRGEHQFALTFLHPHEELESSSPVLLAREPLLFDTN